MAVDLRHLDHLGGIRTLEEIRQGKVW
jgi:hypothetical protein